MLGVQPLGIFLSGFKARLVFILARSQGLQLRFALRFSGMRGCPLRQWVAKVFMHTFYHKALGVVKGAVWGQAVHVVHTSAQLCPRFAVGAPSWGVLPL